jgi:hypothetical protein
LTAGPATGTAVLLPGPLSCYRDRCPTARTAVLSGGQSPFEGHRCRISASLLGIISLTHMDRWKFCNLSYRTRLGSG